MDPAYFAFKIFNFPPVVCLVDDLERHAAFIEVPPEWVLIAGAYANRRRSAPNAGETGDLKFGHPPN